MDPRPSTSQSDDESDGLGDTVWVMRRWLDLVIYKRSSPGRLGSPPRTRGSLRVGSGLRSRAWEVKEPCADVPLVLPGLLPVVAAAAAAACLQHGFIIVHRVRALRE